MLGLAKLISDIVLIFTSIAEPEDAVRCKLPERPVLTPLDPATGTRFGMVADSRWEYDNGGDQFRRG